MNEEKNEKTTISIKRSTKDRLLKEGNMGDNYDAVINRALDALGILAKRRVHKDGRIE